MEVENQEKLEDVAVRVRDADRAAGATVFGSEPDRESVMLGMEQWAAVRQRRGSGFADCSGPGCRPQDGASLSAAGVRPPGA